MMFTAKRLVILLLTGIVIASVACGPPPPPEVIVVTATPPPAPAIPSAEDLIEQKRTAQMLQQQAKAHVINGNNAKAIQLYSQAIELWPNWEMHFNRGSAYARSGNLIEACKDYKIAYKSKDVMPASDLEKLEKNLSNTNC